MCVSVVVIGMNQLGMSVNAQLLSAWQCNFRMKLIQSLAKHAKHLKPSLMLFGQLFMA